MCQTAETSDLLKVMRGNVCLRADPAASNGMDKRSDDKLGKVFLADTAGGDEFKPDKRSGKCLSALPDLSISFYAAFPTHEGVPPLHPRSVQKTSFLQGRLDLLVGHNVLERDQGRSLYAFERLGKRPRK